MIPSKDKQKELLIEVMNNDAKDGLYETITPEIKAENLVDDFVAKWREERNTEDAVYAAYHYDTMVAFAEMYYKLKSQEAKKMDKL